MAIISQSLSSLRWKPPPSLLYGSRISYNNIHFNGAATITNLSFKVKGGCYCCSFKPIVKVKESSTIAADNCKAILKIGIMVVLRFSMCLINFSNHGHCDWTVAAPFYYPKEKLVSSQLEENNKKMKLAISHFEDEKKSGNCFKKKKKKEKKSGNCFKKRKKKEKKSGNREHNDIEDFSRHFATIVLLCLSWRLVRIRDDHKSEEPNQDDKDSLNIFKFQIGLETKKGSVPQDLNYTNFDGSTINVLQGATLTLLSYFNFWIYAYSSVSTEKSSINVREQFLELCRRYKKISEENNKKQGIKAKTSNGSNIEYVVVTILVIARGVHELSTIKSCFDLQKDLQSLCFIPMSQIRAVAIFQNSYGSSSLSRRKLHEDHPLLRPLHE